MFRSIIAVVVTVTMILSQASTANAQRDLGAIKYYDATEALSHKCLIEEGETGYTGSGFANFEGQGSWLEYTIDIPETVTVLVVRYSAGSNDRRIDVVIDEVIIDSLPMSTTGDWNTWSTESIPIPPMSGRHTIRLVASSSMGPNIDCIGFFDLDLSWGQPQRPISTPRPTSTPKPISTPQPTPSPQQPLSTPLTTYPYAIVLASGERMSRGEFVSSPSGRYQFGLSYSGDLQLKGPNSNDLIWRAEMSNANNCNMQTDGNLLTQNSDGNVNWRSRTSHNDGATLILDDGGQVKILHNNAVIWLAGESRGQYSGPSSASLQFPIRGAFYYPWFPETWVVDGEEVFYQPALGKYSNEDSDVQTAHVRALEYAHVDLAIASWFGPDKHLDRARIINLMDKSLETNVKWSVYHEMERHLDQTVEELRDDLDYLKTWFAWHDAWGHVDGRPVIFVYNERGCEVADRWNRASSGEWYVVLKLFGGHKDCAMQPDQWHQYGPAVAVFEKPGFSYTISPGFWRADEDAPRLARLTEEDWRDNVKDMVSSNEDWQLITTFNEWGEGTAVESAEEWASEPGYGYYLDALHDIY